MENLIKSSSLTFKSSSLITTSANILTLSHFEGVNNKSENKNGYFQKAIVHETSGSKDLDQAIVATVKEESPFMNPPLEMVQIDGRIHMRFKVMVSGR